MVIPPVDKVKHLCVGYVYGVSVGGVWVGVVSLTYWAMGYVGGVWVACMYGYDSGMYGHSDRANGANGDRAMDTRQVGR